MNRHLLILVGVCLLASFLPCSAQVPSYYHDDTLDTLNGSVLYLTNYLSAGINNSNVIVQDTNRADLNTGYAMASMSGNQTNFPVLGMAFQSTNDAGHATYSAIAAVTNHIYDTASNVANMWSTNIGLAFSDTNGINTNNDGSSASVTNGVIQIGSFNFGPAGGGVVNMGVFDMLVRDDLPQFLSLFAYAREIILAIFTFGIYWYTLEAIKEEMVGVFEQRQLEGNKQEFLGANISVIFGVAFAGVVTFLVAHFFFGSVSIFGFVNTEHGSIATVKSGLSTLPSWGGWDVVTALIPVGGMVLVFIQYLLWRFLLLQPVVLLCRMVIWLLLA
ncbi:MAG TPA: hypothetical protein VGI03_11680 [Verrucomicrobiae bacterium]|jgi:hypothetical protein